MGHWCPILDTHNAIRFMLDYSPDLRLKSKHAMTIKEFIPPLAFLMSLSSGCLAQGYRIASIHTKSLADQEHGIVRLAQAISYCEKEEQKSKERCIKASVAPLAEDIAKSLEAFAASRKLMLIDADSDYEHYCIIDGDIADVTNEFVAEYNRTHP